MGALMIVSKSVQINSSGFLFHTSVELIIA